MAYTEGPYRAAPGPPLELESRSGAVISYGPQRCSSRETCVFSFVVRCGRLRRSRRQKPKRFRHESRCGLSSLAPPHG